MDGECVPAPAAPLTFDGFTITQLLLESRGVPLSNTSQARVQVDHPIDVTVAVRYEGSPSTLPLLIGLGEVEPGEGFCLLGGVLMQHPGLGEVVVKQRLFVSKDCLVDNSEDGSGEDADSRSMVPVVVVDPDDVLNDNGKLPSAIVFSAADEQEAKNEFAAQKRKASGLHSKALSASTTTLGQCRGSLDEPGTCALTLTVEKSKGVDFELTDLRLESSVLLLSRCFQDQGTLHAYAAQQGLPTGYICNRGIVRGMDAEGKALPYGNPKDYTYGAADIEADSTVTAFGIPHSPVTSADELMHMGSMTSSGFKLDVPPEDITNNALGENNAYTIRYFLRPAGIALQTSSDTSLAAAIAREGGYDQLVSNSKLLPVYLHAEGEQAKGDEEPKPSGQDRLTFEETIAIPHAPTEHNHGLYVENDCGRFNDPTNRPDGYRPGTEACKPELNPRDTLLHGSLKGESEFFVVACITDGPGGDLPESDAIDNNCVERPLAVARSVPRKTRWAEANPDAEESENPFAEDPDAAAPGFTNDALFSAGDASGWTQNYDWDNRLGNNDLSLDVHVHTRNSVTLHDGAQTDNEARLTVRSNLFDFSYNIVRAWAQAAARTVVVGSYYDVGLEAFNMRLIGDRKEAQLEEEWTWSTTKSWSKSKKIFVKIATIDVGFKIEGEIGLSLSLAVTASDISECGTSSCAAIAAKLPGANTIGEAQLTLKPYGLTKASVSASISIEITRVGAAGEITLANLSLPATALLQWGVTGSMDDVANAQLNFRSLARVDVNSRFLSGRIYLFAEHRNIKWCKAWVARYPCGLTWSKFWDQTIASWSGWSYSQRLYSSPEVVASLSAGELTILQEIPDPAKLRLKNVQHGTCLIGNPDVIPGSCSINRNWMFVYEKEEGPQGTQHLYRIVTNTTDGPRSLGVAGASKSPYSAVKLQTSVPQDHQLVTLKWRGDAYEIRFVHSGLCLDMRAARLPGIDENASGTRPATLVTQEVCHGGSSQLFQQVTP